jgi:hypothetical protein
MDFSVMGVAVRAWFQGPGKTRISISPGYGTERSDFSRNMRIGAAITLSESSPSDARGLAFKASR